MRSRRTVALLLAAYLVFLADVTLFQFRGKPDVNLRPFRAIVRDVRQGGRMFWVNVVGNVAAFVPVGAAACALRPRAGAWHVGALALALSGSIELAQYALGRRVADVDDVILNTAGSLFGYAAAAAPSPWRRPGRSLSLPGDPPRPPPPEPARR